MLGVEFISAVQIAPEGAKITLGGGPGAYVQVSGPGCVGWRLTITESSWGSDGVSLSVKMQGSRISVLRIVSSAAPRS